MVGFIFAMTVQKAVGSDATGISHPDLLKTQADEQHAKRQRKYRGGKSNILGQDVYNLQTHPGHCSVYAKDLPKRTPVSLRCHVRPQLIERIARPEGTR